MIVGHRQDAVSVDRYLGGLLMFVYRAGRRYLVLMLVSACVVGAIVQAFAAGAAPVYGGRALVQLGAVSGTTLVNPAIVIAGFDTPSFRQRVLKAMASDGVGEPRSARLISESLIARPESSDVIAVSIRAADDQRVRRAVDAVVDVLNQKQEKKREQLVALIKMRVAALDTYLANLMKIQESFSVQAKAFQSDPAPLTAILLLDLMSRNEEQQASARASRAALQERLGPQQTYPTRLVDDDFPIFRVVGPAQSWRTTLFAVALTLLGFMLFALVTSRKASA